MLKGVNKVIGYFSYTASGLVFCDADACIILGSRESMLTYLKTSDSDDLDIIRKTTLGEIIRGLEHNGVYMLDKDAYKIFSALLEKNEMSERLKTDVIFSEPVGAELYLIRFNWAGSRQSPREAR